MTQGPVTVAVVFVVYLAAMLLIGLLAYARTRDLSDYLLGGRRLGSGVAALSAGASDMSGWLLLGLPGYAYLAGLEAGWIAVGLLIGTYLNWRLVAARLRAATVAAGDALTLPDYFERRFDDDTRALRVIAAFFILLFFTFYASSGLVAGGKLFEAVFGLPYLYAVGLGAVAIVAYTFLGGFLAVSWTDVVQALLMLAALIAVPVAALAQSGAAGLDAGLSAALLNPFTDRNGDALGAIAIVSLLGWGLGYFGQPHILARFMAIDRIEGLVRARRIAMVWVTLTLTGALLAGLSGIGLIAPPLAGADSEKVFIALIDLLFHPLLAGVCLAAILAAIMSTADSQLLVASAALSEDFYKALLRPRAGARELIWVGRGAVVLMAAVALALALNPDARVLELVAYAWAGFGAAFGPAILLSLHWRAMTRHAALAGMLVGGVTVIVWKQLHGGVFDVYELVPGFLLSFAVIVLVSRLGPRTA
ncbi:MAG TPA: sodium/proline symporter PutP [Acidiferrobacterales bacterium]